MLESSFSQMLKKPIQAEKELIPGEILKKLRVFLWAEYNIEIELRIDALFVQTSKVFSTPAFDSIPNHRVSHFS